MDGLNEYTLEKVFTLDDVKKFAELTGDFNPIHLDRNYASKTKFGNLIVHGMLAASLFSTLIANKFPGEGSVYMQQNIKFLKPIFVDQKIIAIIKMIDFNPEKNIYKLITQIIDNSGIILIDGEAVVKKIKLLNE